MSDADHQARWPAGTPVAPSGRGPGGGRFRPVGQIGGSVGMLPQQLREALAAGRKFDVRTPLDEWAQIVEVTPSGGVKYQKPGGRPTGFISAAYQTREHGQHEPVPDWAARISSRLTPRPLAHGLMTHDQVASYLDRTDYEVTGTAGGSYGHVEFRQYADGTRLAYKLEMPGSEADEDVRNEVQTSLIGQALGAPVPAVVRVPNNPAATLMEYIDEPLFYTSSRDGLSARADAYSVAEVLPSGRMIGLLDAIVGNNDRHGGNLRYQGEPSPTGVVGIDHGRAFQPARYRGTRDPSFASVVELGTIGGYARRAQLHYSREAIEEAKRRIEAIKDELDPNVWWGVEQTLDTLARTATGHARLEE